MTNEIDLLEAINVFNIFIFFFIFEFSLQWKMTHADWLLDSQDTTILPS